MMKNKSFLQTKKKRLPSKLRKTAGFWRRVRDSNPRSLSEHDFSRVAPSTTRTTLQYISKHQASEIPRKKERTDGENNGYLIVNSTQNNESYQRFRSLCYHISHSVSRADPSATWVLLQISTMVIIHGFFLLCKQLRNRLPRGPSGILPLVPAC